MRLRSVWCERALARDSSARIRQVERGLEPARQGDRVVVGPEVHEEESWGFVEEVIVETGDGDASAAQRLDDRVHFTAQHHEVPGDRCLAAARWLEIDSRSQSHRGGDFE